MLLAMTRLGLRARNTPLIGPQRRERQRLVTWEEQGQKPSKGRRQLAKKQELWGEAQEYITHLACMRPGIQFSAQTQTQFK